MSKDQITFHSIIPLYKKNIHHWKLIKSNFRLFVCVQVLVTMRYPRYIFMTQKYLTTMKPATVKVMEISLLFSPHQTEIKKR